MKNLSVEKLKFSILLPTHNRADVISYAIESVLYQSEVNFELLIVGDGCSDNTEEIVKEYLYDKRITWFDLPKGEGFGYANRNKILQKAQGEYIAFMAHDDIWFPDHLEILGKLLDNNPKLDLVASRAIWIDDTGVMMPSPFNLNDKEMLNFFMTESNAIPASSFIHKREVFDTVGFWDEEIPRAGDWDFWKRIINSKKEVNFYFEPTTTVFHFKASWKDKTDTWPRDMNIIMRELSVETLKPLIVPMTKNLLPQNVLWEKIKNEPNWLNALRVESLAFNDKLNQMILPAVLLSSREIQNVLDLQRNQNKILQEEIDSLKKSKFYKLRNFVAKIFPQGRLHTRIIRKLIK